MNLYVSKLRCEYKQNPLGIDVLKPRFSWQIQSDSRDILQASYQVQVAASETGFTNLLWDTGQVQSNRSIHVVYEGEELASRTRYYYRVRVWDQSEYMSEWSETAFFETAMLNSGDWLSDWITAEPTLNSKNSHYLRREFDVDGDVKSARVYATALGLYELHCDGEKVGDWVLMPGWTSYHHQLQYQTYEITDKLTRGPHAIGLVLCNGWYKGRLTWFDKTNLYGDRRAALVHLHIVYEDGREQVITSDGEWTASTGPILMSEIYDGETYDARCEIPGWSKPGYDDDNWASVTVIDLPKDTLVAQMNHPTRVIQDIHPIEVIHTPSGDTVIDLGQNMVGWMKFQIQAESGTVVTLEHAEVLDKDGEFYTENLRSAKQTITYICRGGESQETYEPHFTFQGFRYVRVTGYPGEICLQQFVGRVVHTDFERTGEFECSNPAVNQLQHNIVWGQKGNFVDVPTDCPQRDERLGWTGDAQVFIRTAAFNYHVGPFFTKWLRDLKADQAHNGSVPFVIPDALRDGTSTSFGDEHPTSAAWGDAAVVCPWTLYLCYGDERILAEQYDSMKGWVEYIRSQGNNEFLWNTGFHFGDWLGLDAKENSYIGATPKDLIATAFYAYSTRLLRDAAVVLGKLEDVHTYSELLKRIVRAFRDEFVTVTGRVASPTQTAHVLALMFELVEGDVRKRVARELNDMIAQNDYHLTTGFVGTPYLCHVLSNNGYHETAVKLLLQESYPGWLYSVSKGATTIWEHWDGIKPDGSFWSRDMNSYNHYAYGAIGDWLYRVVAGIDTDGENPGYKHIHIHPQPSSELRYAKASLETMYGRVMSHWERIDDRRLKILVNIPPNTTATVVLPHVTIERLQDGEQKLDGVKGIRDVDSTTEGVRVELGSGEYEFDYALSEEIQMQR